MNKLFVVLLAILCQQTLQSMNPDRQLWDAMVHSKLKEVAVLIHSGADVNKPNGNDETPLEWACRWNLNALVKVLLENGANPDTPKHPLQQLQLWNAVLGDNLDEVVTLIGAGVDISAPAGFYCDISPLEWACRFKRIALVYLLLKNGANLNAPKYLLKCAVNVNDGLIVRLLLDHGANPNEIIDDNWGLDTALHAAVFRGYENIARILLDHNADVNLRDRHDWTPLHEAANCGANLNRLRMVRLLLEYGADWSLRTTDRCEWFLQRTTALQIAERQLHFDVAKLLEEWPTMRVKMRLAVLMGCHPRVGANSSLNRLGHLLLRQIIQEYIYPVR